MGLNTQTIKESGGWHPHILLVEDETNVAKGLKMVLSEEGYGVDVTMDGKSALDTFRGNGFDLVVADLRLPDIDGMEVIRTVKAERPETQVVIITGFPSVSSAVAAVKMGVHDYLRKPFTDDEFKNAVNSALLKKKEPSVEKLLVKTENERLIQKQEVIKVLERANQEQTFWRKLMEEGSTALRDYHLTSAAKAAIISGDLQWIRDHVGDLSEKQLTFIYKRLEREAW